MMFASTGGGGAGGSAGASPTRKLVLFHGTSKTNATSIMKTGFQASSGGMLGKGVYLAGSFDKARNFALAAQGRGHGGGGTPCVLTCEVRVKSPKYISSTDTSGKWHSEGHDAVRADGTTMSRRSEWCIADPAAISVITLKEVSSSTDAGTVAAVSDFGKKAGYVSHTADGSLSTAASMSSAEDLFGSAAPPDLAASGTTPSVDDFIKHRMFCNEGCSYCTQFEYKNDRMVRR